MSGESEAITTWTSATSPTIAGVVVGPRTPYYVHVETPSERYLRLSNALADGVEVRMILGLHEEQFIDWAEAADALALLSDLCALVSA